jgi:hypothetical protein
VPKDLDLIAAFATEDIEIAGVRIAPQRLLLSAPLQNSPEVPTENSPGGLT